MIVSGGLHFDGFMITHVQKGAVLGKHIGIFQNCMHVYVCVDVCKWLCVHVLCVCVHVCVHV